MKAPKKQFDILAYWPNRDRCDVVAISDTGIKWCGSDRTRTYERKDWLTAKVMAQSAGLAVKES